MLFDAYILQEKQRPAGIADRLFCDNLYPLLKNILQNASTELPISIVIFAERAKIHRIVESIRHTSGQISPIHDDLLVYLNTEFPANTFEITLVGYDVSVHQTIFSTVDDADKIHDRYLITNYFCIESSGGFDLFKPSGEIAKTTKVTFDFLFHSLNTNYVKYIIENIKSYKNIPLPPNYYHPNTSGISHPFL